MTLEPHPGSIKYAETIGEYGVYDASTLPNSEKYVFFKNGLLTEDEKDADHGVPIVSQEILFLDAHNTPVTKDLATHTKITDRGADDKVLRVTEKENVR